jgi:hypothetical protein
MFWRTRFLVFAGEDYEPRGGWGDFKGGMRTKKGAMDLVERIMEETEDPLEWAHIVDLKTNRKVQEYRKLPVHHCEAIGRASN